MSDKKFCVHVDDIEKRIVIKGLMELKNQMEYDKKSISFIDDLIVRFIDAKELKGKFKYHEGR